MAKSEKLKPFILSWEGGFANIKGDKGGATNKGITIATYRSVFGNQRTIEDLKTITDAEWLYIFEKLFWSKWKADRIKSQSIANLLVDWVWHSGNQGIKIPQKALGVAADGVVGDKSLAAINNYPNEKELFVKLWHEREAFLKRIGTGSQAKFLRGWLNRINGIQYGRLICNGGKIITF
jgi:lysozyme family protein